MSLRSVWTWAEGAASQNGHHEGRIPTLNLDLPSPAVHDSNQTRRPWWRRIGVSKRAMSREYTSDQELSFSQQEPAHGSRKDMDDSDQVDIIVVDRSWTEEPEASAHPNEDPISGASDVSSVRRSNSNLSLPRRIIPALKAFFNPHFEDPKVEASYQKEVWVHSKRLAVFASIFFISNWVLGVIFVPQPLVLSDKIYYYGIAPLLSVPLLFMCAYDFPRDHATFYQCFLAVSTWSWSFYQVLFLFLCDYYNSSDIHLFSCGSKDFLSTFYYTTALQTVALFGTNLRRIPAVIGAVMFLLFSSSLINKASWTRNIINFLAFQIFLLYMHYQRDISARRLYDLRDKLQQQFLRTQQAQINERKAADSKHRLTSYVFHEVRVPLNTALLAVQNMGASGTIAKSLEVEFTALEASLSMMSKVLNDVLDFNRMDTGRFESVARPYAFHQVMRSLFLPLRLATDARNLELVTDLDTRIDDIARRAALEAAGESRETIDRILKDEPSGEDHVGLVVGDETRLMQVIFNLASNACKFTPSGGKLTISTRLILPDASSKDESESSSQVKEHPCLLSTKNLQAHDLDCAENTTTDRIVVRIEVTDTGSGIRPSEMDQTKLFSAFNQTEQGRTQGGKGTGLGLALVRLIVKLSRGRLGVQSKAGKGSTFWLELPLYIGARALVSPDEAITPGLTESPQQYRDVVPLSKEGKYHSPQSSFGREEDSMSKSISTPPPTLRSMSALQGLMDQGGRVELSLSRYNSGSSIPTRTMDDLAGSLPGTGDSPPHHPDSTVDRPVSSPLEGLMSETTRVQRPNYIALPRNSFTFESPTSKPTSPSCQLPSSPLSRSVLFESVEALVVDDDPLTRNLMKRMLERLGVNVTTAENGEVALGILLAADSSNQTPYSDTSEPVLEQLASDNPTSRFSVVFLDNHMPVLSGLQTIAKLRSMGRQDFVVGVTANALISDQNEYLEAGADHVLTKPVLERSLRSMLQLAEERRKLSCCQPPPSENS